MKLTRARKQEIVQELASRLQGAETLYLTDFTGIAVKPMTELRRKLREAGVECVVVKNTLALRALDAASVSGLDELIRGPTAFVLAGADPVAAAKVLAEFQREHDALRLKAGLVEGRTVGEAEIKRLATLPSREELLSQLGGTLQGPLSGFVGVLNGLLYEFAGVLEALRVERSNA